MSVRYRQFEDPTGCSQLDFWQMDDGHDDGDFRNEIIAEQRRVIRHQELFIDWCLSVLEKYGLCNDVDEVAIIVPLMEDPQPPF